MGVEPGARLRYRDTMDLGSVYTTLVWLGAGITLAGLGVLVLCILRVARARSGQPDEAALRAQLAAIAPWNLGALCLCAMGLMMVVIGLILG